MYPNLECVVYDQLYDVSCFGCDNTDCKVSDKKVHNNTSIHTYIDNNQAFYICDSEYVSSDTVTDLVHEVNNDLWYETQRQTNVPWYAYCVAPWQVNCLYSTTECICLLVLNCDNTNNVWNENESAVSQCCKVSFFEYFDEYSYTFSPVVYTHTGMLEHKWYQYKSGYYGLHHIRFRALFWAPCPLQVRFKLICNCFICINWG